MKVKILEDQNTDELEVIIKCREKNKDVDDLLRTLKLLNLTISGKLDDRTHIIDIKDVFYFESVEEKIFCYTEKEVFETKYRLYELESLLPSKYFLRVSKTTILNLKKIKSFKSILSGRVECTLKNDEKVLISRMYVKDLKNKLGINRGGKR